MAATQQQRLTAGRSTTGNTYRERVMTALIYESLLPALPPSPARMRQHLAGTLTRHDVAPRRVEDIALVLTEAATNVVRHAYPDDRPGPIYAAAALTGRGLAISVIDFGRGMGSPSCNPGSGFGLMLMKELSDDIRIRANDPDPGTSVHALFEDVRPTDASRPPADAAVERARMLREYHRTWATHASLRPETDAVMEQASRALAHAGASAGRFSGDQSRSNLSRFITFAHAATKSCTNFSDASSLA
jgi:anti-sigma regulatory factor (Ser/Thr protein kinase)